MASIMHAIKCPHCGRSAFGDYFYKTSEEYVHCLRCGYNHSIINKAFHYPGGTGFEEERNPGCGVSILTMRDGQRRTTLLNHMSEELIENLKSDFSEAEVDPEKSYIAVFQNKEFTIIAGTPTDNFHLPFEAYKERMRERFGDFEDWFVPMEE